MKSLFKDFLSSPPEWRLQRRDELHLIIDGTYFKNNLCLILYRDQQIKYTQFYRLTDGEWYDEIREDLENILSMGVSIASITCDGHPSILKAVRRVCKNTVLQRCTVHLQRMCRAWLSEKPKSIEGLTLLKITQQIGSIKTIEQSHYWMASLVKWYNANADYINEKSMNPTTKRTWFRHKNVRRSFVVLKRALPNMFHYLNNPLIPKSTNPLEAYFGHLKSNLSIHRGLSKENKKGFIKWYLHFRNSV